MKTLSDDERQLIMALIIKALVDADSAEQAQRLNDLLNKISGVDRRILVE